MKADICSHNVPCRKVVFCLGRTLSALVAESRHMTPAHPRAARGADAFACSRLIGGQQHAYHMLIIAMEGALLPLPSQPIGGSPHATLRQGLQRFRLPSQDRSSRSDALPPVAKLQQRAIRLIQRPDRDCLPPLPLRHVRAASRESATARLLDPRALGRKRSPARRRQRPSHSGCRGGFPTKER